MSKILDAIIAQKKIEVAQMPLLANQCTPSRRDFAHAIATQKTSIAIIAEIKRATPFRGVLRPEGVDAKSWGKMYEDGGAAAISVLTDEQFFHGSLTDLESVAKDAVIPVLRKDFIIDAKQIFQARHFGADAILLIARILTDDQLQQFQLLAESMHMRSLVEVHDAEEMARALKAGARIIGINNRNLETGQTDLKVTEELIHHVPRNITLISESGIETPQDIQRLNGLVDAVLIGTSIMKAPDPMAHLTALTNATAV